MEIPERVKVNILTLLVEQGQGVKKGIALDRLTGLYEARFSEPLDINAWGFSFLQFFQAMPKQFRLKFERREEAWKVFPVLKRNPLLPEHLRPVTPPTTVYPGRSSQQTLDTSAAPETFSSGSKEEDSGQADASQLSLVPDQKGLYSVCFPVERKPEEWTDLKEMFNMAGPVVEIHRLPTVISVHYSSPDAVRLAMKLFPFLGLSVARANIEAKRQGQCLSVTSQPKEPDRVTGAQKENLPAQSQTTRPPWRCSIPQHQNPDMPALEPFLNSGIRSSDLSRDADRVMESAHQEQASKCEMMEEGEENVSKKPLFGQVLGENIPPGGKDGGGLKTTHQRCVSEHKTSKRAEEVGIGFLKQLVRQMSEKKRGEELSRSKHFPVEHVTDREMPHIGRGCRMENSHMEQTPSYISQEHHILQRNHLQQLNDRERPHGRGQYWENLHQRQVSVERSQSGQESFKTKTAPQKRMFDRDFSLESVENECHNTFDPSNSVSKEFPQTGFYQNYDQQRHNPGRGPVPKTGEYVHDDLSHSGHVAHRDSRHRDDTSTHNTIFKETFKSKPPHETEYCVKENYQEFQWGEDMFKEEEGYMDSGYLRLVGPSEDVEGSGESDCVMTVPQMSPLEERIRETGVELPCIFATHFQKWATEKHLSRWFAPYNPVSICLVQCAKTGMPKAHIELSDVDMVRRAVYEMNQQRVCALRIKVDVPYFLPRLRAEVLGTNPVSLKRMRNPKLSPFIGDQGMLEELSLQRVMVGDQLNAPDFTLQSGEQVEVTVTHVINDSLFMGQLMWPDVQQKLGEISEELSSAAEHSSPPGTHARLDIQGPCMAKWKKDYRWHRAWLFSGHAHSSTAEVYLLDKGALDFVAWPCVRRCDSPALWDLPPVALPFSLTEPIVKLKNRLHSQITVTVTAIDKNGIVTAKPVSLVSNWKEILNIDTVLC